MSDPAATPDKLLPIEAPADTAGINAEANSVDNDGLDENDEIESAAADEESDDGDELPTGGAT